MQDISDMIADLINTNLGATKNTANKPECDMPLDPDKEHITILKSDFDLILNCIACLSAIEITEERIENETGKAVILAALRGRISSNLLLFLNKYPKTIFDNRDLYHLIACFKVPFSEKYYHHTMKESIEIDVNAFHAELHLSQSVYTGTFEADNKAGHDLLMTWYANKSVEAVESIHDDDE